MNPFVKLAAFALALVVLSVVGLAVGAAVGSDDRSPALQQMGHG